MGMVSVFLSPVDRCMSAIFTATCIVHVCITPTCQHVDANSLSHTDGIEGQPLLGVLLKTESNVCNGVVGAEPAEASLEDTAENQKTTVQPSILCHSLSIQALTASEYYFL